MTYDTDFAMMRHMGIWESIFARHYDVPIGTGGLANASPKLALTPKEQLYLAQRPAGSITYIDENGRLDMPPERKPLPPLNVAMLIAGGSIFSKPRDPVSYVATGNGGCMGVRR